LLVPFYLFLQSSHLYQGQEKCEKYVKSYELCEEWLNSHYRDVIIWWTIVMPQHCQVLSCLVLSLALPLSFLSGGMGRRGMLFGLRCSQIFLMNCIIFNLYHVHLSSVSIKALSNTTFVTDQSQQVLNYSFHCVIVALCKWFNLCWIVFTVIWSRSAAWNMNKRAKWKICENTFILFESPFNFPFLVPYTFFS
jgi:hypothetical protein